MDIRHKSFINMRNQTNLSKWLVFDYIKRLLTLFETEYAKHRFLKKERKEI